MEKIKQILATQTIKDTFVSFLGLGFTAVTGFVFTIIMARHLGPDQFGVFSAVTALVAIVYSVADMGIASSLINYLPKHQDQRSIYLNVTFFIEIFLGLTILVGFYIASFFNSQIIPGSLSTQLILAGILSVNYLLIGYMQGIFTADRRFLRFSISQIIDAGLKIIFVLVIYYLGRLNIELALISNIISTIFAILFTFGKELIALRPTFERAIFHKIYSYSIWIAISRLFSVFISRIDILLLNLMASGYQAGIYSAANRITLLFSLLVSSLGSVVNPRFSSFDNHSKVTSYMKKLFLLVSGISASMIVLTFFAQPIILLVFGDKYLQAIPVFKWLTISMIPFIFTLVTTPALIYSFNKPSFMAKLTIFQVITIVIIEVLYIPRWGAYTPAIALGLTNSIVFILSLIKIQKILSHYE